jgi:hypothetical protein
MTREAAINHLIKGCNTDLISDGDHTFGEIYEHRNLLFITLCKAVKVCEPEAEVWKSIKHADGSTYKNWFILGLDIKEIGQITYHLPIKYWDQSPFAKALEKAPDWDKHTSEDVLKRLSSILKKLE